MDSAAAATVGEERERGQGEEEGERCGFGDGEGCECAAAFEGGGEFRAVLRGELGGAQGRGGGIIESTQDRDIIAVADSVVVEIAEEPLARSTGI